MQTNLKPLHTKLNLSAGSRSVVVKVCLLSLALFTASFNANAANCKGKAETLCTQDTSCSWVSSYERKDGRVVKGFCRTKTKGLKAKSKMAKPSGGR